jgi:hypothetical protein
MAAHGFNQLQADQYVDAATGEMYMRRQMIFFSQLNPVFIPEPILRRHAAHGIAKLAIQQRALQFLPGQNVTSHSVTE